MTNLTNIYLYAYLYWWGQKYREILNNQLKMNYNSYLRKIKGKTCYLEQCYVINMKTLEEKIVPLESYAFSRMNQDKIFNNKLEGNWNNIFKYPQE